MERAQGLSLLASSRWLSRAPAEFRERFLSLARWRRIEAGKIIQIGGEDMDDVIGLAQGSVVVTSVLGEADTPITHMVHGVYWLGYGPLMTDEPRRISAEARSVLWVARFPKANIRALLAASPVWWRCLLPLAVEYGDICALIASDLLIRRSDRRLAATILRFAGLRGPVVAPCDGLRVPITQGELAAASNLSRNVTAAILHAFEARGWVRVEYRGLVLQDPDGLQRFVATAAD